MPPKKNKTKRTNIKRKVYTFNHEYTTDYGEITQFRNGRWHNSECEDHSYREFTTRVNPRLYQGYHDVARYTCLRCEYSVYISLRPKQYVRWKSTMNAWVRHWKRFRWKRRLTLQTVLLHTCKMIDRITEMILEYVDTQPTQSNGLRLKEQQVVLPLCEYTAMNEAFS